MRLEFSVYGIPRPQGSLKAFNVRGRRFPIVTSDNPRTRPWKATVTAAAVEQMQNHMYRDDFPWLGAMAVALTFYLPKPKSTPKRVTYHTKLPDLDKLVRAVFDALTNAGVWKDDAQVIYLTATKLFVAETITPSVRVELESVEA